MTIQERYIRTLKWCKYEDLTKEEIGWICDSTAYHVFALKCATDRMIDLITTQVYVFGTWINSGIRRGLRN